MNLQYHLKLSRDMIKGATRAVLAGDPGRVEKTARAINPQARFLPVNREYTSWLAPLKNQFILVCSTGIGGSSAAIALEELAKLGVTDFFRIGTSGVIQPDITPESVIITTASVRLDGASTHYAPIEFPAVADPELTALLIQAARQLKIPFRTGITASSATFYPGQERYDTFSGYVINRFRGSLREWQKLHVLNYEMESATLFVVASVFGLRAAMVSVPVASRLTGEAPDETVLQKAEYCLADLIKRTLEISLA